MNINLTMLGQAIAFLLFVLFCMKYVWPPLTGILRERQKAIADGLEKAAAAEQQLQQAKAAAGDQMAAAKQQAAQLVSQAQERATRILEDAKAQAKSEAERIREAARNEIDLEVSQAKETLRAKVGQLAVAGAEKILEAQVDQKAHATLLDKLARRL